MAFKKVAGQKEFIKSNQFSTGDYMLKNAEYVGVEEGQYGPGYLFNQDGDLKFLCATAGIHRMHETGKFVEGAKYNLIYQGQVTPKNPANKPYHTYDLEVDEDTLGERVAPVKAKEPAKAKDVEAEDLADDITL